TRTTASSGSRLTETANFLSARCGPSKFVPPRRPEDGEGVRRGWCTRNVGETNTNGEQNMEPAVDRPPAGRTRVTFAIVMRMDLEDIADLKGVLVKNLGAQIIFQKITTDKKLMIVEQDFPEGRQ